MRLKVQSCCCGDQTDRRLAAAETIGIGHLMCGQCLTDIGPYVDVVPFGTLCPLCGEGPIFSIHEDLPESNWQGRLLYGDRPPQRMY